MELDCFHCFQPDPVGSIDIHRFQLAAGVTFGPYKEWNDGKIEVCLILFNRRLPAIVVFDCHLEPGCFHCFQIDPGGSIEIHHLQVGASVTFGPYIEWNDSKIEVHLTL